MPTVTMPHPSFPERGRVSDGDQVTETSDRKQRSLNDNKAFIESGESVAQRSTSRLASSSNDDTLYEDANPSEIDRIVITDWSHTGRGSHVEFSHNETVPLEQGKRKQPVLY
jgi:hypothetical protein